MENGQGCWIYYESTLESSFFQLLPGLKLNLLSRFVESGNQDPMCKDPVREMAIALINVQDVDIWADHVLWLAAKRPEKALEVSMYYSDGLQ